MERDEFRNAITDCVSAYIKDYDILKDGTQLMVNPESLMVSLVDQSNVYDDIDNSNTAVEAAAAAHGLELQDATDYQASRNPDYYSLATLVKYTADGKRVINDEAIERIVDTYC